MSPDSPFAGILRLGMTRSAAPVLVTMAMALPAASFPAPAHGIADAELAVAGISMDLTEQQVRERLGQPLRVTEEVDFLDLHLHYQHLVISFSDEVIASLYSESPRACTPAGLCPGDPLDRAVALYGPPVLMERGTGVAYWVYPTRFRCFLQVAPVGGKVGSIRAACGP